VSAASKRYNRIAVADYWSRRLEEAEPLSAVLTFDAPAIINEAYHSWEIGSLEAALRRNSRKRQPLSGKAALDIACGIGRITQPLARLGATTSAADISSAMLRASRRRCRGLGVSFVEAAADALPFSDNSFDIITCFGLLEHLPAAPRMKCLAEIGRLLHRGGRAYLVVNNSECIFLRNRKSALHRSGYHVELVGFEWLKKSASRIGLRAAICAANPGYALAHYDIWCGLKPGRPLSKKQRAAIGAVLELNELLPPDSKLTHQLASHYLVECRLSR
jgi:2-polyprenyl-3-methyl-5-hydroxy-6-metoxy-1,4-benzoquinol methylase